MWGVKGTGEFDDWLRGLDDRAQARVVASIDKLATFGPTLGRPDVDTLHGSRHPNMKELRIRYARSQFRVLFAFDPRRSAILLLGGDKVGDSRFYERMIERADALYDAHLAKLRIK